MSHYCEARCYNFKFENHTFRKIDDLQEKSVENVYWFVFFFAGVSDKLK